MTNNELAITMYLEGCKAKAVLERDIQTEQLLTRILEQVDVIIKGEILAVKNKSGICEVCKTTTRRLIHGKYCRLCADQFID